MPVSSVVCFVIFRFFSQTDSLGKCPILPIAEKMSAPKVVPKVVLINMSVLIIGILFIEIFFGDWLIDNRLFFTRIPRDMILEIPVDHVYGAPGGKTLYSRDKYGFRGSYEDLESIDILTVGGSTTDQRYIDDQQTWQHELKRRLEEKIGKQISVVNAGVDGQSTFGHIMNFDYWFSYIPRLQPDYILYYVGINDIQRAIVGYTAFDDLITVSDTEKSLKSMLKPLVKKSAFYNLWIILVGYSRRTGNMGHKSVDFSALSWRLEPIPDISTLSVDLKAHLKNYSLRLKDLAQRTRAFGAEPIFSNQFTHKTQVSGPFIRIPMTQSSQVALGRFQLEYSYAVETMRVCLEVRALCVDLYTMLRENMTDTDYYNWAHNTPAGAEKIGQAIANVLGSKNIPLDHKK